MDAPTAADAEAVSSAPCISTVFIKTPKVTLAKVDPVKNTIVRC